MAVTENQKNKTANNVQTETTRNRIVENDQIDLLIIIIISSIEERIAR